MKRIGKRLIALLAAFALAVSVFTPGSAAVKVKADEPQTTGYVVRTSDGNGTDAIEAARLWYIYRDRIPDPQQYTTWAQRRDIVISSVLGFNDPTDFRPDESTDNGQYLEKIDRFVFDEVTVDTEYHNQNYATRNLVVTSDGAITMGENNPGSDAGTTVIRVTESASVDGSITLEGVGGKEGILEIGSGATLAISRQGLISTPGDKYGYIRVCEGAAVIDYDSEPVTITVDEAQVTLDGQQRGNYYLYCRNSAWEGAKGHGIVTEVVLPKDGDSFRYTLDDWYNNKTGRTLYECADGTPRTESEAAAAGIEIVKDNGKKRALPPSFTKVTINCRGEEYPICNSLSISELVVTEGSGLKIQDGQNDQAPYDKWTCSLDVNKATINGTVKIEDADAGNDEEGHPFTNKLTVYDKLTITEQGKIIATGNGELSFGEYDENNRLKIDIPSTDAISSEQALSVNPYTIIFVDNEPYTISVASGNPGDDAVHDGFLFDGEMNSVWAQFRTSDDGWELADNCEVWWGAPFIEEYRVYFDEGSVKAADGSPISTDSFLYFTVGTPIEIELTPPAGKTPIVFINGGYYNIGKDYMRSDDFKTADLWWANPSGVKQLAVADNKFSYTPLTSDGIEIYVYYDPEEIMYDAMYFLDRRYLDLGEAGDDGKYHFHPENAYNPNAGRPDGNGEIIPGHARYGLEAAWAEPGNEFMVEVTQNNANGTVEMTPGIDFYRIGNKVKALYQGFELLNGGVDVKFKPASGYDLLAVTIDGMSYSPTNVGMTYSGGTYTLKIKDTPNVEDTVLKGLYPEKFRNNDYVKIKKIAATFGIRPYSNPDPEPVPAVSDPTPIAIATPDTPVTTEPADDKEPEVVDTVNRVTTSEDGTETTTNVTTYDDGSQVTEKVVEKPDGSTTSTTTTTEADGTKIVEKVEEKADGSSKTTTTTTETDGTKTTETVEKKSDGTEVTTSTVKDADGNSTTEKVEKKTDGTVTTTNTIKDADGASTTEKIVEKPDGSVTTTSTEKDADGNVLSTSKVVEKTKEDGTKTITATGKNADGSTSTSKTTINSDGSLKTNTTIQNADGSTTKEKITGKGDGSLTRTATTTDEDGNVLSTEKEKVTVSKSGTETSTTTIENADGSTSESVVKTKADGTASSTLTETDAAGNVSVTVGSTKKNGSGISKSYAVEDDGVVLTSVEATTTSATIPATVKVNGKSVPVTTVGEGAMKGNETVKTVKLADTITSIGEGAFGGARNLKTIKLSANVTEIAPDAFEGISSKATFYITAKTDKEFDALVELLKKSGVGSKVKFKRS